MAVCLVPGEPGTFDVDPAIIDMANCITLVAVPVREHGENVSFFDVFSVPIANDLQELWMVGFSLPLIVYLTCWAYGVVINWFRT